MATDRPGGADDFDDRDKDNDKSANPFEELFALFNQMPGFSQAPDGKAPELDQLMNQLQSAFAQMGMAMPSAARAARSGRERSPTTPSPSTSSGSSRNRWGRVSLMPPPGRCPCPGESCRRGSPPAWAATQRSPGRG